jgi:hypothetical protein
MTDGGMTMMTTGPSTMVSSLVCLSCSHFSLDLILFSLSAQTGGVDANRQHVKVFTKTDSAGPAAMFLVVLEVCCIVNCKTWVSSPFVISRVWFTLLVPFSQQQHCT